MALPRQKLALIAVATKALHLEDEDYRAILGRVAVVSSARELDDAGFDALMREFRKRGFESDFSKANHDARPGTWQRPGKSP